MCTSSLLNDRTKPEELTQVDEIIASKGDHVLLTERPSNRSDTGANCFIESGITEPEACRRAWDLVFLNSQSIGDSHSFALGLIFAGGHVQS